MTRSYIYFVLKSSRRKTWRYNNYMRWVFDVYNICMRIWGRFIHNGVFGLNIILSGVVSPVSKCDAAGGRRRLLCFVQCMRRMRDLTFIVFQRSDDAAVALNNKRTLSHPKLIKKGLYYIRCGREHSHVYMMGHICEAHVRLVYIRTHVLYSADRLHYTACVRCTLGGGAFKHIYRKFLNAIAFVKHLAAKHTQQYMSCIAYIQHTHFIDAQCITEREPHHVCLSCGV